MSINDKWVRNKLAGQLWGNQPGPCGNDGTPPTHKLVVGAHEGCPLCGADAVYHMIPIAHGPTHGCSQCHGTWTPTLKILGLEKGQKEVIQIDSDGNVRTVDEHLQQHRIQIAADGTVGIGMQGEYLEEPEPGCWAFMPAIPELGIKEGEYKVTETCAGPVMRVRIPTESAVVEIPGGNKNMEVFSELYQAFRDRVYERLGLDVIEFMPTDEDGTSLLDMVEAHLTTTPVTVTPEREVKVLVSSAKRFLRRQIVSPSTQLHVRKCSATVGVRSEEDVANE